MTASVHDKMDEVRDLIMVVRMACRDLDSVHTGGPALRTLLDIIEDKLSEIADQTGIAKKH